MASKGPALETTPPAAQMPWWKEPTRDQWYTLMATWAGWCLDVFDYFLLALVLTEVTKTFGVSLVAMGTVFTATLICRLIGGVIFGTWGDRVGRKFPLMVSILTFAVFSALSGLAPNFKWFFVCRIFFGLGMGGEWAAGTPLAMESWPVKTRGVASGFLQGGYPCGYFLATVTYYIVFPLWGWRALFLVGFLPALLVIFVRKGVKESPVFLERREALQKAGKKETGISVVALFKPGTLGNTVHACLFMTAAQTSAFCMSLLWPTYLTRELHLTIGQRTQFLMLLNAFCILGYWTSGSLSEKLGRRRTLVIFGLIAACVIPLYSLTHTYDLAMLGAALAGYFAVGLWGVIPAYLSERFPTAMRASGVATCIRRRCGNRFLWAHHPDAAGAKSRLHARAGDCARYSQLSRRFVDFCVHWSRTQRARFRRR